MKTTKYYCCDILEQRGGKTDVSMEINCLDISMDAKEKAGIVYERLMEHWGMPNWNTLPAIDELVNTILSQNTNDRNRDIAFAKLKETFPNWDAVRDAPTEDVIECIRTAGLANQKGPRIQKVLRAVSAAAPDYDLTFLKEKSPDEAKAWLTSFEGVGLKTASIVMVFSIFSFSFIIFSILNSSLITESLFLISLFALSYFAS